MQAVILAGGKGTRLHPLTRHIPKPMVPLFDRPVLEHTIALLKSHGIRHLIFTLSYRARDIIEYFGGGSRWGVHIQYAIEDEPLGTAGGLKAMQPLLRETFCVLSGDGITDFDLSAALEAHRRHSAEATMLLYRLPDPAALSEFGVVETDAAGRIQRFVEKPAPGQASGDTINTGIYLLEPSILTRIPGDRPFDFSRDLFPELLREGARFFGYRAQGYWCDIGNLGQYRQVHQDALAGKITLDFGAFGAREVRRGVWIGPGAQMHPSAQFLGPCYVGSGTQVQERAVVAGGAVLGRGSRVGAGARIAASVIGAEAYVGPDADLRDCIVGDGYRLSDGYRLQGAVLTRDLGPLAICARTGRALTETPTLAVQKAA
ncbi:MAG TPA: NDP-sugar synthase [Chthonomonadaceae bacterium]|nr:NDP-sugar synthase [Chthonomonadaceae bacterium]